MAGSGHSITGRLVILTALIAVPVAAGEPAAGGSAAKPPKTSPKNPTASGTGVQTGNPQVDDALKKAGEAAQQAVKAADQAIKDANKASKTADKASDKASKAEEKATKAEEKAAKADEKAEKAADKAERAAEKADQPATDRGEQGHKDGLRGIVGELRDGKLKKTELKQRLAKHDEERAERRKRHREALREKWGRKLASKAAIHELEHHSRRQAQLDRMLLVLETEYTGKDKAKLIERIEKLSEREDQRHERKMSQLDEDAPAVGVAASASAAASAAPASSAAGGAQ
jgi:hypothetical protein